MKDFLLNVWRWISTYISDVFWHLMFKPKGIGLENIPKEGGVIVACNHLSHFDPMFVGYYTVLSQGRYSKRQVWTAAKEELFKIPVVGFFIRSYRGFPVKRGRADLKSLERIVHLAKNHIVIVYPEGTRSKDGTLGKGTRGVGKIILDSGAKVVPAAVFNTQYCLPKGAAKPKFFIPLSVVFGKPLDLSRFAGRPGDKETAQAVIDDVMIGISALQKEYSSLDMKAK